MPPRYTSQILLDQTLFGNTHDYVYMVFSLSILKMGDDMVEFDDLLTFVNVDRFLVGGVFLKSEFIEIGDSIVWCLKRVTKGQ